MVYYVAMLAMLRRVFRPNAPTRRIMAGLCAAFVLATISISSLFVAVDADHDCSGHDCPVCQEMQTCIANFQLSGSSTLPCDSPIPATSHSFAETAPCARRAPATTLQSLDVRFDE